MYKASLNSGIYGSFQYYSTAEKALEIPVIMNNIGNHPIIPILATNYYIPPLNMNNFGTYTIQPIHSDATDVINIKKISNLIRPYNTVSHAVDILSKQLPFSRIVNFIVAKNMIVDLFKDDTSIKLINDMDENEYKDPIDKFDNIDDDIDDLIASFSSHTLQTLQSVSDSPSKYYTRIESDYIIPINILLKIRSEFVNEMCVGLMEDDMLHQNEKKSSLKMLSSHIQSIPNGTEKGVFYTLDWGGSNFRILRIEFSGIKNSKPIIKEFKTAIETKYKKCNSSIQLFDYLAQHVKNKLIDDGAMFNKIHPIGFTFSFPMAQPAINKGILVEWTKGFDIPSVVGKDIVQLMHNAFKKKQINSRIHAVCNDTVGTLLSCAYTHKNVRVALVLGTGSNACYIEPNPFKKYKQSNASIRCCKYVKEKDLKYWCNREVLPDLNVYEKMRNNNVSDEQIAAKMLKHNIPAYWINKFFISQDQNDNEESIDCCKYVAANDLKYWCNRHVIPNLNEYEIMRNNNVSNEQIAEKMFANNIAAYWINKFFISERSESKNNNSGDEVINIEWGAYSKLLPRMSIDIKMDETTPNPGVQYAEKMISGYYIGELVRLLSIEVFRYKITDYGENSCLNCPWKFESKTVSFILANYYNNNINGILDILHNKHCRLMKFNRMDAEIFAKICKLIINRSADLAATLLLGTLGKTGLFTCKNDKFELTEEYCNNNKYVTVGIDGSVFQKVPKYKQRMEQCIYNIVGYEIGKRIKLVLSNDGSGKGVALAVAASLIN